MKKITALAVVSLLLPTLTFVPLCSAQEVPAFTSVQARENGELLLKLAGPKAANVRIETSTDLVSWKPLITLTNATGAVEHTDTAAPFLSARYYRSGQLNGTVLTGDHLDTDAGDVIIHPIFHATMIIAWKDVTIWVDPTGSTKGLPLADIVLVTHVHGDHYDANAIGSVLKPSTTVLVSKDVYPNLSAKLKPIGVLMNNGDTKQLHGVTLSAVPAYNANHPKGNGNGYVLTIGGRNIYISGDTDDVVEMRALRDIDVAFVCMDGQFNMKMSQAASAVREFRPKVIFPYHYNSQNPATFKQLLGTDLGIEVRQRKWQ